MSRSRSLAAAIAMAGIATLTVTASAAERVAALAARPAARTSKTSRAPARLRVAISFPKSVQAKPVDGRVIFIVSTDSSKEPRFQIADGDATQQMFGVDVNALAPGVAARIDGATLGYPRKSLSDIPAGVYWVQGVLHVYETFRRSDGHTVKLPPDRGEGQQWNLAPGNLYSTPRRVRIDPAREGTLSITLDKKIAPFDSVPDTKYVKHISIISDRLSKFWGRPVALGAVVLLPDGWDTHPQARYPLAINHGHFQRDIYVWRESPPDPKLPPSDEKAIAEYCPNGHEGDLCTKYGYERVVQQYGYDFFKRWTSPGFPRAIMITIEHANPFYDDSYAVNSENLGPYGDAITYELIPYIEKTFRGLGPWARSVYGGSTGGWEALGVQVMYPDEYNGAWVACPDPIDFHNYTSVNIYEDTNAYYAPGPWKRSPRPGERDYLGRTRTTVQLMNQRELVLGDKSRSGGQWDIWEAVFSPVGTDGYPQRIWDKRTGVIDRKVAEYWREHYDLVHIMRRDWATLGPKLRGKLTINVGLSDNFYLNNAVYRAEDFLKNASNPPADAKVDYGQRDEHCWSGDHEHANAFSRLTYESRLLPDMSAHWLKTAPAGADTVSWRY
jgi:hypothetical protein